MKIIFLNCWLGKLEKELFGFIEENKPNTDIFALQEITRDLHKGIKDELPEFNDIESHKILVFGRIMKYLCFLNRN